MTWVVQIELEDRDDDTTDDIYGPFRSQAKAQEFADKLTPFPEDPDGQRVAWAKVRPVHPPRVRTTRADVRAFIED